MNEQIKTGYIPSAHKPEDFLGSSWPVINPGGHWQDYAPTPNVQQNVGIEAEDCTSQGSIDCVETLLNFLFKDTTAWSKRYLAWKSDTTPTGNDPTTVGNCLASEGTVPHADWQQTADLTTWADFYATPPQALQIKALEFPAQYALSLRPMSTDAASLIAGLQVSPIGVAGYAWAQDTNGLYYTPPGALPGHFFALIDYMLDATQPNGVKFVVFDSYEGNIKYLRGDYVFSEAIQYRIVNNVVVPSAWKVFLQDMFAWLGF